MTTIKREDTDNMDYRMV